MLYITYDNFGNGILTGLYRRKQSNAVAVLFSELQEMYSNVKQYPMGLDYALDYTPSKDIPARVVYTAYNRFMNGHFGKC